MQALSQTQMFVAESVLLDSRLALYHVTQKWLAVADLHFGFELSQRRAGRMVPWWGMESTTTRLLSLLGHYQPGRLIIVGDLVHDKSAAEPVRKLLALARLRCEVTVVMGNHDTGLRSVIDLVDHFSTGDFEFHHGHSLPTHSNQIRIIGHLHPAATLRDGAGLHLKFPAFVQEPGCWVLPAFSEWAGGVESWPDGRSRVWLCTPRRILRLEPEESAA